MKKLNTIFVLAIATLFSIVNANATTVIIQAIGTSSATDVFSPQTANAVCGDTIRWVLVSGTHTTASTNIPSGATPWTSGNITASGYIYVVTVEGNYNYTCHPATGGHMNASIVVTCGTSVPAINNKNFNAVYPNPSNGKITISLNSAAYGLLEIYNVAGEKIFQSQLTNPVTEEDLSLPDGIYFYELKSEKQSVIGKGNLILQK